MELADLQIFKTVVDEGGIVKAARKLHRVQSSVSSRIKQLEISIGAQLFYRDKQRLFITPSGELLIAYADKLLRLSEEARSAMSGSSPHGLLKLGALESTTASRLPEILASYHRAYPEVRIDLTSGTNDALTAAVVDRRLDAAFVVETPSNKALSSQALFSEHLVIISSADHPRVTRPQDVEGDSLIAFPNGCAYRRILERWVGAKRFSAVRVLEFSSYHAIVACVAAGAGIALMPESVLATLHHKQVAKHPLPKIHAKVVTPLIWRTDDASAALHALREELQRHMLPKTRKITRQTGS
ncbi:MAG: LysR family transcriptional regulator [Candidimonas sp.]|nr:MAG: LysR family transcriptional regulator [Candidimonas sp.]TAM24772.1 MAG: LysR family transcriptional regulator [Candidimonas sp.]TAM74310.1 MAG: LysR family transcriptional regulator [Candidimonas sp.]